MKTKFNVAMIGCGHIAERHLDAVIAKKECVLYALCDNATDDRVEQCRQKYGAVRTASDYRELLNDPNIDVAIVTTPDNSHAQITAAFLRAGKDVLLEKPMALTLPECEEMLRAEKESGRKLMVGQVCRYNGNFIQAKQLVEQGTIGDLVYVESEYAHDYSIHRGYKDWRVNPEREGMIGGGCHAVDLLRWIAGDPTQVTAYSTHKYLTDWPVNDTTIAIFRFPNDVIGKVFCSIGVKRNYTMRTALYGTKGTLILESGAKEMTLFQCDAEGQGYTKPQMLPCTPKSHNMEAEVSDFIDALMAERPMPVSPMEGASTVAVCRAAVESARLGQPVDIVYPKV